MRNDLAALVGSRICHDLISPIGAIGNGVELLSLTQQTANEEMSLITDSVENATSRIRFFRIAYGAATDGQTVARSEIISVLTATAHGGRFSYLWDIDEDQLRRNVRIAFLLMQCLETAMPLGGDIHVELIPSGWALTATGPRFSMDPQLWETLHTPNPAYRHSAAEVQFAILPTVLTDAGRSLSVSSTDDQIYVTF